ncbi:MAG: glycosyltransferase family 4 protein [Legionellales bacterium]|nr:glycosyltransferase family 4 protein [Legionellales bacterium]
MLTFFLSLLLTGFLRHYALTRNLMDVPNGRSSHVVPTPRGGGVAFIIAFLLSIPVLSYLGFDVLPGGAVLIGAGLFVAALGFVDDHAHMPARYRLLGHFAASVFSLYWLGGMPSIWFLGWVWPMGFVLNAVAVIYLVWLVNLYNFMDGIDGLAAVEAITVCLGGAFLFWLNGAYPFVGLPLVMAATVAGFLWWNFPLAKIFMGDSGSGFLGFVLGLFTIQAAIVKPQLFWCWLILLGVFIVDTTLTLMVRLFQRMKIYEAHRDHAYQHATCRFGAHLKVTLGVLMINCCWLLPMAILVDSLSIGGMTGLTIAYVPLVLLAIYFKAGKKTGVDPEAVKNSIAFTVP